LPFFLSCCRGAIADVVDRRKLLLYPDVDGAGGGRTGRAHTGRQDDANSTVVVRAADGVGAVLNDPAWQAITPETVSRQNFTAGVALNSAGFNVARAIGPALGGL